MATLHGADLEERIVATLARELGVASTRMVSPPATRLTSIDAQIAARSRGIELAYAAWRAGWPSEQRSGTLPRPASSATNAFMHEEQQ